MERRRAVSAAAAANSTAGRPPAGGGWPPGPVLTIYRGGNQGDVQNRAQICKTCKAITILQTLLSTAVVDGLDAHIKHVMGRPGQPLVSSPARHVSTNNLTE